jgi:ferredoxin--NADP+ reductase
VAVIGSGPSGFYAAEALFKGDPAVHVDMFERLPTPFGLVRGGVAPDHPKIKSVTRVFDRIAGNNHYRFIGNVTIGEDISVEELKHFYDAVIFAIGAETDRRLNIPGEDLPGSYTATEFVGWYNGHPDYRDREFDLSGEVAVIIGQGNVAMDVSRILAKTPDELRKTDISQHAIEVLAESRIREIHLIGRRGPVQAKFTPPEIKEMGDLADCEPEVRQEDLDLDPSSQAELDDPKNKHAHKNMEVLRDFASRAPQGKRRKYFINFLLSPTEIQGDSSVHSVVFEKNRLEGEPFELRAVGTGEFEHMRCDLFFRSVGYRGVAIPGVPFDERRGVFPNQDGRIIEDGVHTGRLYAVGWIKRGPSGIIGTNKPDSVATVDALLADIPSLTPCQRPDTDKVLELLRGRGVQFVSFDDWQKIDMSEVERGKPLEKPREKYTRVDEMLNILE